MAMTSEQQLLSAYEAACVTGVPLKTVRRIIAAGLLRDFAEKHEGNWMFFRRTLVGLKLAYETADILTLDGRRRLVRHVLEDPDAGTVREEAVSVDVRPMKNDVKRRMASLEKAKKNCERQGHPERRTVLQRHADPGPFHCGNTGQWGTSCFDS